MKKLAVLLVLGFLMAGVSAMAQEYELQLVVFNMPQDTVLVGENAFLNVVIFNPAPYGSGIFLSGIGYMTIDTPWGSTITRGPIPINNVTPATSRRKNWAISVAASAQTGVYSITGWLEMAGVPVDTKFESIEVVAAP
jgi:hypothetical protein